MNIKADVKINGFKIGEVKQIGFEKKGNLIIELNIKDKPPIPTDSKFLIENFGFLGSQEINVELGNSEKLIQKGDTIYVFKRKSNSQVDSLITNIYDIFSGSKKQDSILKELKILNEKLDSIESNKK